MKTNKIRIIAGQWRGRKIEFSGENIRPTPDRVRETLFNWLMNDIQNAVCCDCFAGSGSLGFEALSRGAQQVFFTEKDSKNFEKLRENCKILNAKNAKIIHETAENYLKKTEKKFDIIFLDAPFYQNFVAPICKIIDEKSLLKPHGLLYLETESQLKNLKFPKKFNVLKQKKAGQVTYYLLQNQ